MSVATPTSPTPLITLDGDCRSKVKVSSVLNRDVKQFGKKYMFDDDEETCWNSDQGAPQFVSIELPTKAVVEEIHVKFQGGFAGRECALMAGCSEARLEEVEQFYPKDSNSLQCFPITCTGAYQVYKIIFKNSTDFFGRITVYSLQLYGSWESKHS